MLALYLFGGLSNVRRVNITCRISDCWFESNPVHLRESSGLLMIYTGGMEAKNSPLFPDYENHQDEFEFGCIFVMSLMI